MRGDRPNGALAGEGRLHVLDALDLARLAPEEDALDGCEVEVVAGHLDLDLDFVVTADVAPGRVEARQARRALDEEAAVPLDVGEADLGRVSSQGDGAMREGRGLLGKGALGELVGLAHEAGSNSVGREARGGSLRSGWAMTCLVNHGLRKRVERLPHAPDMRDIESMGESPIVLTSALDSVDKLSVGRLYGGIAS